MPSRRDQIRMTQPEIEAFLESRSVGVLGTVDVTGAPHMVNMAYLFRDGAILFSSFAKAQKVVNLQRHPRASFLVEIPDPYHEIRGVLARGDVRVIDDPEGVRSTMEEIQAAQLRRNSPQPPVDVARVVPKRVLCVLEPDHIASWDHSRLGGAY